MPPQDTASSPPRAAHAPLSPPHRALPAPLPPPPNATPSQSTSLHPSTPPCPRRPLNLAAPSPTPLHPSMPTPPRPRRLCRHLKRPRISFVAGPPSTPTSSMPPPSRLPPSLSRATIPEPPQPRATAPAPPTEPRRPVPDAAATLNAATVAPSPPLPPPQAPLRHLLRVHDPVRRLLQQRALHHLRRGQDVGFAPLPLKPTSDASTDEEGSRSG